MCGFEDLSDYLSRIDNSELTGFGKEIKYLFGKGFTYNPSMNVFIK